MEQLVKKIENVSKENDPVALQDLCEKLKKGLPVQPGPISTDLARRVLKALRASRSFNNLKDLAQAFINDGCKDDQIFRQYGQALIETGMLSPAMSLLEELINNPQTSATEVEEARGILGRAWKERALAARGVRDDVAAVASRNAYENYKAVYDKNKQALYQGINRVALAVWDRGLSLNAAEIDESLQTASDILKIIEDTPEEKRPHWDLATAGEALIALGRVDDSIHWFKKYAVHKETDAFSLASTIRQLEEVWKLGEGHTGQSILGPLRAKLCMLPGGGFCISYSEARAMAEVEKTDYEKVLGDIGSQTYTWMKKGFDLAASVALIRQNGRGIGTGFLVRGGDLNPGWDNELVVLTNSHVVSEPPMEDAALPSEITMTFEISADNTTYEVKEILWQSAPDEHDVSVLKLEPELNAAHKPVRLTNKLPVLEESIKNRVYIIGHPRGGELSFSFEDNELLDYEISLVADETNFEPCKIHYRTPTEPGSSGSPVFNANWATIGIHHLGSKSLPKLNDQRGMYGANEGIWIESIKRAIIEYFAAQSTDHI